MKNSLVLLFFAWVTILLFIQCMSSSHLVQSIHQCGTSFIDHRDQQEYQTVQIGSQCWMAKNMNIGTLVDGNDYHTECKEDIQKKCYNNEEVNCSIYGGLYSWCETVNGERVSKKEEKPNYKYVSGNKSVIQGICPDGWHIPSDKEWTELETLLGMHSGKEMKSVDYWIDSVVIIVHEFFGNRSTGHVIEEKNNSKHWIANNNENNGSRFNGYPSGRVKLHDFEGIGKSGYWWTSSFNKHLHHKNGVTLNSLAWYRSLHYDVDIMEREHNFLILPLGLSVRCLMN